MPPLILLAEIKVHEITDGKSYDPSMFPVNFILKRFDRRVNSSSNSPRVVGRSSTRLFSPYLIRTLEAIQYDLRFQLRLDNVTVREAIRRLNSYIALNPQPRRLEVSIIEIIMVPYMDFRDDEVMSWLRELEHDREIKLWESYRVEDMDFKDDEEYCCPICLENMAVQKEKVLPVTMTWSHIVSVFMKYFAKRNRNDDYFYFAKQCKTMVTKMICNHVFHNKCIIKWLISSPSCPVCRLDLKKLTEFFKPSLEI